MIKCSFENGNTGSLRHICADVLVFKDGKILLVKRSLKLLEGGKWGIVGGYAERDEKIAGTAAREVHEETGWEISDLTLLTINDKPDRPGEDRQNVTFVYFANATQQTGKPDWESDERRWFDMDDLPSEAEMAFDHHADIELYKRYLSENLTLPII